jgi:hypothetical protein
VGTNRRIITLPLHLHSDCDRYPSSDTLCTTRINRDLVGLIGGASIHFRVGADSDTGVGRSSLEHPDRDGMASYARGACHFQLL